MDDGLFGCRVGDGLLTPESMPRLGMAAIGAVVVVLRLIVGFVPPMVAVGRVVEWLVQRGAKQIGLLPLEAASAL